MQEVLEEIYKHLQIFLQEVSLRIHQNASSDASCILIFREDLYEDKHRILRSSCSRRSRAKGQP